MGTEVLPQLLNLLGIVIGIVEVLLLLVVGLWRVEGRNPNNTPERQKQIKENVRTGLTLFFVIAGFYLALKLIGPIYRLLLL